MKYYSEKLDQLFESEEALKEAEISVLKKTSKKSKIDSEAKKTEEVTTKEETVVTTKKQLAAEVEAADEAIKEAYANYELAKTKVEEISKAYLAEVNSLMDPAKKAVKDAEQKRYEAIRKFNESYGVYQVSYTGAKAADEFRKAVSSINSKANNFLRDWFWF